MNIKIFRSVDDAVYAEGLTVVIDVFRAFSTEVYFFAQGVEKIYPVQTLDEAFELKRKNPDFLLAGERGGLMPEGFDYGNSPTEIQGIDFTGKTIIHTTSNGTKGLLLANNATAILTGSFVNAEAIYTYIQTQNPDIVSFVSTSPNSTEENEDLLLAFYLRDRLQGKSIERNDLENMMKKTSAFELLFNEVGVPKTDFDYCLQLNSFPFIIKQFVENGRIVLKKICIK